MNRVSLLSKTLSNKVRDHEARARDVFRVTRVALGRGVPLGHSLRVNDGYLSDAQGEKWIVNALARGRGRPGDAIAVKDALRLIQYISWPSDRVKVWPRRDDFPDMQRLETFFQISRLLQLHVVGVSTRRPPKRLASMPYPERTKMAKYLALELTGIAMWYALEKLKCPPKMGVEFKTKAHILTHEFEYFLRMALPIPGAEISVRGKVPRGTHAIYERRERVIRGSGIAPQGDAIYIGEGWDDEQEDRESILKTKLQRLIDAQVRHRRGLLEVS